MRSRWTAVTAAAAALFALSSSAWAQSLEEKRDAKLAEAWLKNADWITDYDKAREKAADSGKLIFAYFTRSYAP